MFCVLFIVPFNSIGDTLAPYKAGEGSIVKCSEERTELIPTGSMYVLSATPESRPSTLRKVCFHSGAAWLIDEKW